ncbi:uncharacterized protein Dwil_GK27721 [Drosophila willistoni]|uniref:Secreted protein n=1 Tax=Drosophila willistoni TaxID=7260 RepID=A0A0Q9WVJ2_DROWI|nr:uncharacterized protein LOC26529723 [Drosophila willistoni]KRG00123.1 uncharacterized protein Dwil_GK27721 [Drosophila willistoni]
MKPSAMMTRLRHFWIVATWLRQEAVTSAGMMVLQRRESQRRSLQKADHQLKDASQNEVGQMGVDWQGNLRRVRLLDDYVVPIECSL